MLRFTWETEFKPTKIGEIPKDWELAPLTELISHVVDNRGATPPTSESGFVLIATNCIVEDGLYPKKEKVRYVSEETYKTWFTDHPKPGDIIIVNKGTPGVVCLVPEPVDFCMAQDMVAIRPNETRIYGKYLFAYMRSRNFKYQVDSLNVGTTVPHLKKTVFSQLQIPIPPKEEQVFVGDTYLALSEKIENEKEQNDVLEKTALAIFKSWFVDFEPFKDSEFVNSEMGEIPGGFTVGKLSNICKIIMGQSPSSKHYNEQGEGLPFIQGKGQFGRYVPNTSVYCSQIVKLAKPNDILVTVRAPVGELNIADDEYIIGRGLASLRSRHWVFIYLYLRVNGESLKASERGTTFDAITAQELETFPLLIPPQPTLEKFNQIVEPFFQKIILNQKQIAILRNTRDALLPLLIFGKLRAEET